MLRIVLQRSGDEFRPGILLFINRGRAKYEEVTPDNDTNTKEEIREIRKKFNSSDSKKSKGGFKDKINEGTDESYESAA